MLPDVLYGMQVMVAVDTGSGAGGDTTAWLVADAGEVWVLEWALGFHADDHAARTTEWDLYDQITSVVCPVRALTAPIAASVFNVCYGSDFPGKLVLTPNGVKLGFKTNTVTAAHNVSIRALVTKYRSVPDKV